MTQSQTMGIFLFKDFEFYDLVCPQELHTFIDHYACGDKIRLRTLLTGNGARHLMLRGSTAERDRYSLQLPTACNCTASQVPCRFNP